MTDTCGVLLALVGVSAIANAGIALLVVRLLNVNGRLGDHLHSSNSGPSTTHPNHLGYDTLDAGDTERWSGH